MPGRVAELAVVTVVVSVGTGVTVAVVDVTVTTGGGVDTNGRVKRQREDAVFAHEPLGVNDRDQDDLWAVDLNEEGPRVGFTCFGFNDERCGNLSEEFTGFDMADLEVFLRGEELLAQHGLAREQGVASRHAHAFADTKPLGVWWEHRSLADDEVLLDFVGLDGVVEVEALSEWVTDDVSTDFNAVDGRRCDERLRC